MCSPSSFLGSNYHKMNGGDEPKLCFLACWPRRGSGSHMWEKGWSCNVFPLPCGPFLLGEEASFFLLVGVQSGWATWRSFGHEFWSLQSMGDAHTPSRESTVCIQWLGGHLVVCFLTPHQNWVQLAKISMLCNWPILSKQVHVLHTTSRCVGMVHLTYLGGQPTPPPPSWAQAWFFIHFVPTLK